MTNIHSNRARFGPYAVDLHTHELWKFGTRLKLVGQPFEILAVLVSRHGELVTRKELRNRLWPSDTFVDFNHGLNAAVNKLREALSDSADNPRYIETLPRLGYRFIAKVEWLEAKPPQSVLPEAELSQSRLSQSLQSQFAASRVGTNPPTPAENPAIASSARDAKPILTSLVPLEESAPAVSQTSFLSRYLMGAGALFTAFLIAVLMIHPPSSPKASPSTPSMIQRTRPLVSIADTNSPAFSPDGTLVAFFREHSQSSEAGIYVTAVGSDQLLQLTSNPNDCCPVWSSDSRWIAFTRLNNHEYSIYIVPADGGGDAKRQAEKALAAESTGPLIQRITITAAAKVFTNERKLDTSSVAVRRGGIDWSPDGKSIAFAGPDGIYLVSPENSASDNPSSRRITNSPPLSEDWGPSFSLDGTKILFVRDHQSGLSNEIQSVSVTGGDSTHIFTEPGRITSPPQWSSDGHSIIFSSNRTGHTALWRVSLDAPDSAAQINEAGSPAWDPAISRRGYRLAYERLLRSLSIWQMDLSDSADKRPYLVVSSTSDTDQGPGPQFSPDSKRLAYMSDRTGTMEIWISNRDGSNGFQLSAVGGAGTPRWSPDSQSVAFDVGTTSGSRIVAMNLHGGEPQMVTRDHSVCPSWSRDGKWIYFASTRSGDWQVWKIPATGGDPIQVTHHGGHAALESHDGKYLYYAKNATAEPEIWRVPLAAVSKAVAKKVTAEDAAKAATVVGPGDDQTDDGSEEKLMPLVRPGTWASWQVVEGGILFVGPSLGHQAVLSFYDFAKDRTTTISVLERTPFWLGATPDGKTIAFDQPGREQDQAMLVENFR